MPDNFQPSAGFHECHENPDGTWTHYLCFGPPDDHRCGTHGGFCDYDPIRDAPEDPVPVTAGEVCANVECIAARLGEHRHPIPKEAA